VTTIALSSADPAGFKADAVVVGIEPTTSGGLRLLPGAEKIDKSYRGTLVSTLKALGATAKADEVTRVPSDGATKAGVVLAVGLGELPADDDPARRESLRRAAGAAVRSLHGSPKVAIALPAQSATEVGAVAEGALLGAYTYSAYKSGESTAAPAEITVSGRGVRAREYKTAVERAEIIADAVRQTRDWVNAPPRDLAPKAFADDAVRHAKNLKLEVDVLDDKALAKGGYGGILGVGQGSANPPRLVRIAYRPARARKQVAFVGKGITFDSGGLSLKPADAMTTMKCDMGGAAAVLAAVVAVARLSPHIGVTAYAPLAENMPSGSAQRPSDVLTTYGGKTVEVLNTDAEGRLVLADAIARAGEDNPDLIVDVATLTGAAVVALGNRVSAIMAGDDDLLHAVHATSRRAGEQMWPMPLPEELRAKLDSPVADIANVGERPGGALSAGVFLSEFVPESTRWAHLDIAGTAFNESEPHGYTPKGGTGAAVRTLVQLVDDLEADLV